MTPLPLSRVIAVSLAISVATGFAAEPSDRSPARATKANAEGTTTIDVSTAASAAESAEEKASGPSVKKKKGRRPLEKGMNEATIIEIIGKPTEVKPMEAPEGKAEMWIYRKEAGERAVQVVVGQREVPAFTGVGSGNNGMATTKELIYGTKHVKLFRVTSLLMFNGELTVARQTMEQSDTY